MEQLNVPRVRSSNATRVKGGQLISITPVVSKKEEQEQQDSLSRKLDNKRIAGNSLTNFIEDINNSNEEAIDQGHQPSWVLEKSALNLAYRAIEEENKNWLDLIGKVNTYGGGNYARTQKGRKIIRDAIAQIDLIKNKKEEAAYKKQTRDRAEQEHQFTLSFSRVFNMPEGPDRDSQIELHKKLAFELGLSAKYQSIYLNYDQITEREGKPIELDDGKLVNTVLGYINEPGNFGSTEAMGAGIVTYLAERNIKVGENQQSKIDKLLKSYVPLEKTNEWETLNKSITDFGENYGKKLSVDTKYLPDQVSKEIKTQELFLIRKLREVFNEHRKIVKDSSDKQQWVPYGSWSTEQKNNLQQSLLKARDDHFDTARSAIKTVYDNNKPPANDPGPNDEFNDKSNALGILYFNEAMEKGLSPDEQKLKEKLENELFYRWPDKYNQWQKDIKEREKPVIQDISFAEGTDERGDPTHKAHTEGIRKLLAENAFQGKGFIKRQLRKYYSVNKIDPDEDSKAEIKEFVDAVKPVEDLAPTQETFSLLDNVIDNIFPGYKAGLLNLASLDVQKSIPGIPLEAHFIIRDTVNTIKDKIKDKLRKRITGEDGKNALNVPYDLWSNDDKENFNEEIRKEIDKEFFIRKGRTEKTKQAKGVIAQLESLAAPTEEDIETPEARGSRLRDSIYGAFPDLKGTDLSGRENYIKLSDRVNTLTELKDVKNVFRKFFPIRIFPKDIEVMKLDILESILQYHKVTK